MPRTDYGLDNFRLSRASNLRVSTRDIISELGQHRTPIMNGNEVSSHGENAIGGLCLLSILAL